MERTQQSTERTEAMMATTEKQGLWDEHETAEWLGMSVRWLRESRVRGDGPPFLKFSRRVRYAPSDVSAWALEHRRQSTAEAA